MRSVFSSGFARLATAPRVRPVAFVVSVALAVGFLQVMQGEAEAAAPVKAAAAVESFERPDVVSARLAAASLGREVLVSGETSATSLTWARPDGTLRSEVSAVPVRVAQPDGSWREVDLDLVVTERGTFAPKVGVSDVEFSGGGSGPAVMLDKGSRGVDLRWAKALPKPTVEGPTARYDLGGGLTLVLTATAEGFEQSLVLAAPPVSAPKLRLGFDPTGLALVADSQGGYDFVATDAQGGGDVGGGVHDPDAGDVLGAGGR